MTQKLKLGAVGTGGIFKNAHLPAWLSHPDIEVVALCDVEKENASSLADEHQIANVYSDIREMLSNEEIDMVDICTPNLYHSEYAVASLEAGKHVFCEKPDAVNPEEAQRMADAAEASGKTLMVMRNNRFSASSQYMKQFIEEGHMGDIYTGRCGWVRRRGIPGRGGWFTTKSLSGGGPLIDLGVHFIDVAMWLMGNPKPVSVTGATYTKFANSKLSDSVHSQFGQVQQDGTFDVEDLATGFIRFENESTLQIEFSWASNIGEEKNFYELRGTKAGASCVKGELSIFSETAGQLCDITPKLKKKKLSDHGSNIYHFVDVVQGKAKPIFVPSNGVDMIKILSAVYESARTGSEVKL